MGSAEPPKPLLYTSCVRSPSDAAGLLQLQVASAASTPEECLSFGTHHPTWAFSSSFRHRVATRLISHSQVTRGQLTTGLCSWPDSAHAPTLTYALFGFYDTYSEVERRVEKENTSWKRQQKHNDTKTAPDNLKTPRQKSAARLLQ